MLQNKYIEKQKKTFLVLMHMTKSKKYKKFHIVFSYKIKFKKICVSMHSGL